MRFLATLAFTLLTTLLMAQGTLPPTATFHVKESNAFWEAAVTDTMERCVINAGNIAIMNTSFPMEKNISRQMSFKLTNANGEGRTVNGQVAGIAEFGGQQYYTAELEIGLNRATSIEYHTMECILTDLTGSDHRLIIGRELLGADFKMD